MSQYATRAKSEVLAERLRQAREYLGLSQEFAASQLSLHRPALTLIESGKRTVSAPELAKFSELYRRPVWWLLGLPQQEESLPMPPGFAQLSDTDKAEVGRFVEFLQFAGRSPKPKEGA